MWVCVQSHPVPSLLWRTSEGREKDDNSRWPLFPLLHHLLLMQIPFPTLPPSPTPHTHTARKKKIKWRTVVVEVMGEIRER